MTHIKSILLVVLTLFFGIGSKAEVLPGNSLNPIAPARQQWVRQSPLPTGRNLTGVSWATTTHDGKGSGVNQRPVLVNSLGNYTRGRRPGGEIQAAVPRNRRSSGAVGRRTACEQGGVIRERIAIEVKGLGHDSGLT